MFSTGALSCNLLEDIFGRERAWVNFFVRGKLARCHPSRYYLMKRKTNNRSVTDLEAAYESLDNSFGDLSKM